MPIATVYRIEHEKTGLGPYNHEIPCLPGFPYRWSRRRWSAKTNASKCPDIIQDSFTWHRNKASVLISLAGYRSTGMISPYKFGFASRTQLNRWFSPAELRRLFKLGFRIVVRKAELVAESRKQCLFVDPGKVA